MLQKRIPVWALAAIVAAVLILFGIGSAIHSAGWSDGFVMGLLAGGQADGASLAPYLAFQNGNGLRHSGFGGFFGGIFHILFLLFAIAVLFKFLGFIRLRMHGPQGQWERHGWHHHGPSWARESSGTTQQSTEDRPQESTHL